MDNVCKLNTYKRPSYPETIKSGREEAHWSVSQPRVEEFFMITYKRSYTNRMIAFISINRIQKETIVNRIVNYSNVYIAYSPNNLS